MATLRRLFGGMKMGTLSLNINSIYVPCTVCKALCLVVKTTLEDSRTVMHPESCGACIKANHEDFVKSHEPNPESIDFVRSFFAPLPEPEHSEFISSLGRPVGSLDTTKRAESHCSRCGAVGRRASQKRNGCCYECHHTSDRNL